VLFNVPFEKMKKHLLVITTITLLASLASCTKAEAGVVDSTKSGDTDTSSSSGSTSADSSSSSTDPVPLGEKKLELTLANETIPEGSDFYGGCNPLVQYFDGFKAQNLSGTDVAYTLSSGDKTFGAGELLAEGNYSVSATYTILKDGVSEDFTASSSFSVTERSSSIANGKGYSYANDLSAYKLSDHSNLTPSRHNPLKSIGTQKVLVVPVYFNDDNFNGFSTEELANIDKAYNGEADETGWQSVASYYKTSSYGLLNLSATVTAPYHVPFFSNEYEESVNKDYYPETSLLNAVVEYLRPLYNLSDYDENEDGYIDALELVYKYDPMLVKASKTQLWTNHAGFETHKNPVLNPARPICGTYAWNQYTLIYPGYYKDEIDTHALIKETGNLLGLDNYNSVSSVYEAPCGGVDMMDMNVGDHNAYSKMILGWVKPQVVDGTASDFSITLDSFTEKGDCLILRNTKTDAWNGTPYDEYLLLQYYTPTGLNEKDSAGYGEWASSRYGHGGTYEKAGLQVFHVDSRLADYSSFVYTDKLTDNSFVPASNTKTFSADLAESAAEKRWLTGSDYRLVKAITATGNNDFIDEVRAKQSTKNIFESFGAQKNLFGLPEYGCGSSVYTNYSMRNLFASGARFDDGTSLNWSFTVSAQTDENITLHFLEN
jgi:M6 family metalloprotease-like protein